MMAIQSKTRSAADAIDDIKSGATIGVGHLGAEPTSLTESLWHPDRKLRDITVLSGLMLTDYRFLDPSYERAFRLKTWFMPGSLRGGDHQNMPADYLPLSWTQTAKFLQGSNMDVALIQVSEGDRDGYFSLGISTGQHWPMIRGARKVIAEINPAMPRTCGNSLIHESAIDIFVRAEHPLLPFPHREADDIDKLIGAKVAELVINGSTIQFGIGTIPSAVLDSLIDQKRRNLTVLSQITDPAQRLIDSDSSVDGSCKAIVGEILGTEELYRWSDGNKEIQMVDALSTHSIASLMKRKQFVSINSALEIDLYGQINSETLAGRQIGALGGSLDYAIGAQMDGNLSIIALRSTSKKGGTRIVPQLAPGPVTLPRSLIQVVVTEHGVADLRNKTMRERALLLANLSEPSYRETLLKAAATIQ